MSFSGLSLLEVSLVLAIMGILAHFSLPLLEKARYAHKAHLTERCMETVLQALGNHLTRYSHLPCPCSPENQGIAPLSCRMKGEFRGVIPYKTLGIPLESAKDAFGNWMTYIVEGKLTEKSIKGLNSPMVKNTQYEESGFLTHKNVGFLGTNDNFFCDVTSESPLMTTSHALDQNSKNFIALVLISHGPRGAGAYNEKIGRRNPVNSSLKKLNSESDGFLFCDSPPSSEFDDSVKWFTRDMFVRLYAFNSCIREFKGSKGGKLKTFVPVKEPHDSSAFNTTEEKKGNPPLIESSH